MASEEAIRLSVAVDADDAVGAINEINNTINNTTKATSTVGNAMRTFGNVTTGILQGIGQAITGGLLGAISNIGNYIKQGIDGYKQQIEAENKLRESMRLTGEYSEAEYKEFLNFAGVLQKTVGAGDDATLNLIALGKSMGISNQNMKPLIKTAYDLSAVYGIDVSTAMRGLTQIQEGQVGILGRYIPKLREMEGAGKKSADMFNYIAGAVGGQAENIHKVAGGMTDLNNSFGDFLESIGGLMLPLINNLASALAGMFDNWTKFVGDIKSGIDNAKAAGQLRELNAELAKADSAQAYADAVGNIRKQLAGLSTETLKSQRALLQLQVKGYEMGRQSANVDIEAFNNAKATLAVSKKWLDENIKKYSTLDEYQNAYIKSLGYEKDEKNNLYFKKEGSVAVDYTKYVTGQLIPAVRVYREGTLKGAQDTIKMTDKEKAARESLKLIDEQIAANEKEINTTIKDTVKTETKATEKKKSAAENQLELLRAQAATMKAERDAEKEGTAEYKAKTKEIQNNLDKQIKQLEIIKTEKTDAVESERVATEIQNAINEKNSYNQKQAAKYQLDIIRQTLAEETAGLITKEKALEILSKQVAARKKSLDNLKDENQGTKKYNDALNEYNTARAALESLKNRDTKTEINAIKLTRDELNAKLITEKQALDFVVREISARQAILKTTKRDTEAYSGALSELIELQAFYNSLIAGTDKGNLFTKLNAAMDNAAKSLRNVGENKIAAIFENFGSLAGELDAIYSKANAAATDYQKTTQAINAATIAVGKSLQELGIEGADAWAKTAMGAAGTAENIATLIATSGADVGSWIELAGNVTAIIIGAVDAITGMQDTSVGVNEIWENTPAILENTRAALERIQGQIETNAAWAEYFANVAAGQESKSPLALADLDTYQRQLENVNKQIDNTKNNIAAASQLVGVKIETDDNGILTETTEAAMQNGAENAMAKMQESQKIAEYFKDIGNDFGVNFWGAWQRDGKDITETQTQELQNYLSGAINAGLLSQSEWDDAVKKGGDAVRNLLQRTATYAQTSKEKSQDQLDAINTILDGNNSLLELETQRAELSSKIANYSELTSEAERQNAKTQAERLLKTAELNEKLNPEDAAKYIKEQIKNYDLLISLETDELKRMELKIKQNELLEESQKAQISNINEIISKYKDLVDIGNIDIENWQSIQNIARELGADGATMNQIRSGLAELGASDFGINNALGTIINGLNVSVTNNEASNDTIQANMATMINNVLIEL